MLTAGGHAGLTQGDMMRLCEHFGVQLVIAEAPAAIIVKRRQKLPSGREWVSRHFVVIAESGKVLDPEE